MNTKIIFAMLAIALLAGCAAQQQGQEEPQTAKPDSALAGKTIFTVIMPGAGVSTDETAITAAKGTKLFDALRKSGAKMEYEDYTFGKMITAIGTAKAGQGSYIAIYVNSVYAEKGVSEIIPENGDIIEFRLEKIDGAPG